MARQVEHAANMRARGGAHRYNHFIPFNLMQSMSRLPLCPASLIAANRLPARWRGRDRFVIAETGFGQGLNFLATWRGWRDDADRPALLHYVAIEPRPLSAEDLARLHAALPPGLADLARELRAAWPPPIPGFHRLLLDRGRVALTLILGDIEHSLAGIDASVDAFYLAGVPAPAALARLSRLAAPEATLASDSMADGLRKPLAQAGFALDADPETGTLAGRFAPRWQVPPRRAAVPERAAIVIGAGLAGSAACHRLAARGWQVTLIERHAQPAREASGNLAGIVRPLISKDDNLSSQLVRAAYLFTRRLWDQAGGIGSGFAGEACGVLQLAADAEEARSQRETAQAQGFPRDYAEWIDGPRAAALTGAETSFGGWLFAGGGWVHPASFCRALLDASGPRLRTLFMRDAAHLRRSGNLWQAVARDGALIAEAPVVVIANGTYGNSFHQTQYLPLAAVRGQVTHIPAASLPGLPMVLCGEAYLTRAADGICSVGASYDFDDDPLPRSTSQRENLERLARMLPHAAGLGELPLAGRVGFRCVTPDRLPLAGALPDYEAAAGAGGTRLRDVPRLPGAHALLGYGSRGLIWAPFAAELLASSLNGEPLPIEATLAAALDPARFLLKAHRRGQAPAADPSR
jgi:tRNA 5-methylaminomethyl-2-thiouridine biosynthesis bifunctional protein